MPSITADNNSSLGKLKRFRWQLLLPSVLAAGAIAALALHGRIPQPVAYHDFADQRTILGVPHFWNVISNLPFFVAGILGLVTLTRNPPGLVLELKRGYATLFVGCLLLAFGSGYYHLQPDNDSLAWDRAAMSIVFMAFFTAIIGEHISVRAARLALAPLVAAGIISVTWWWITEASGHGDLRLYDLVQFLPMLLIPVIIVLYPSRLTRVSYVWAMLLWYGFAKVLELLDGFLYELSGVASGHTVKHLASAAAIFVLIRALWRRALIVMRSSSNEVTDVA